MKTQEDLRELVCPHHSLPQDYPEKEEEQLFLDLKVEETKSVELEVRSLKRARREE